MATNQSPVLEPRQLNDADVKILDELHRGRATPGYLSQQTNIEQTYINQRLRRLEEHGHVSNPSRGLWEVVDDPRREGDEDDAETDENAMVPRADYEDCLDRVRELEAKLEQASGGEMDLSTVRNALDELETAWRQGRKEQAKRALQRAQEELDE